MKLKAETELANPNSPKKDDEEDLDDRDDMDDEEPQKDEETKENYNPKTINDRIRKLLNIFEKKSYVGYTATPFANIFVNEKAYYDGPREDNNPFANISKTAKKNIDVKKKKKI